MCRCERHPGVPHIPEEQHDALRAPSTLDQSSGRTSFEMNRDGVGRCGCACAALRPCILPPGCRARSPRDDSAGSRGAIGRIVGAKPARGAPSGALVACRSSLGATGRCVTQHVKYVYIEANRVRNPQLPAQHYSLFELPAPSPLARSSKSFRSRAFFVSFAARSSSLRASAKRPSFASKSPRTAGKR